MSGGGPVCCSGPGCQCDPDDDECQEAGICDYCSFECIGDIDEADELETDELESELI